MFKNLIVTPTGSKSLYKEWIKDIEHINFDVIFVCYEDGDFIDELKKTNYKIFNYKGEKWKIIQNLFKENYELIEKYDYFWFPDDDLKISTQSINKLFTINSYFNLTLSQPSSTGYTSYPITNKQENSILRYTNFVEIMCPLMSKECLIKLIPTFDLSKSGWGLDYLWIKMLNNPINKVAIIDDVVIEHIRPVASNYENRFEISPMDELMKIMKDYNLKFGFTEYGRINKV